MPNRALDLRVKKSWNQPGKNWFTRIQIWQLRTFWISTKFLLFLSTNQSLQSLINFVSQSTKNHVLSVYQSPKIPAIFVYQSTKIHVISVFQSTKIPVMSVFHQRKFPLCLSTNHKKFPLYLSPNDRIPVISPTWSDQLFPFLASSYISLLAGLVHTLI